MKYKVGDKVRIHDCTSNPAYNGAIGTVVLTGRIKSRYTCWDYLCRFDDMADYPFNPKEMEHIVSKGKQWEFSFMREVL